MANKFLNGIDTTSLSVNSQYSLPTSDGSNKQVLQTDGNGNVTFSDVDLVGAQAHYVYYEVKNSTGSTIPKGAGVMAVGTDGNSGHILVSPMVADGTVEPKYFMGVTADAIGNGQTGEVIHFGMLTGFDTSGFTDGDVLYCDPANDGDFVTSEPAGPNLKLAIAFVVSAAINGKIFIRVQGNEGLHELHDVNISSQADGDLLQWNATSGVWENKTLASIADSRYVNVSGDTMTGTLSISNTYPRINLNDTDNNDDWSIINANGTFEIYNQTDDVRPLQIDNSNDAFFGGDITVRSIKMTSFGSGNTDITGLLSGSTFGSIIQAPEAGHLVIGLRENDAPDSFAIMSGGNNYNTDGTYDKLLARFRADGIISLGGNTTVSGNITANSLIKSGGTSSQFLKADGSVDSSTYLTSYDITTQTDPKYVRSDIDDTAAGRLTSTHTATGTDGSINLTGGAYWYMYGFGSRGASSGSYGIGLTSDIANRTLSIHVPNHAAYGSTGSVPKIGFYSNGAVEIFSVQSDSGNTYVRGLLTTSGISSVGDITFGGTATTTNQDRGIYWTAFDKEGTTDYSDTAHIRHTTNTGGLSGSVLEIKSHNDAGDGVAFTTNSNTGLKHNSHTIWTAGNDGSGSGLDADLLDGNHASAFATTGHTHDDRYFRRYSGSVSGVDNTGYTTAFTVDGGNLASSIRFSVQGTTGNVVVSNLIDLVVNHSQDIMIKSHSGVYTVLTVKVVSDNNEDFAVELKTNSANAVTLYIEVLAYGDESVTFTSSHSYTGSTLEHTCTAGFSHNGRGGDTGTIRTQGEIISADDIRGLSFVKSGGTSSQFLKADGSVDSNTYLIKDSNQSTSGNFSAQNITANGYLQSFGLLYTRSHLQVLNSAGNGWNQWATRTSGGNYDLNVNSIYSGGNLTTAGNLTVTGGLYVEGATQSYTLNRYYFGGSGDQDKFYPFVIFARANPFGTVNFTIEQTSQGGADPYNFNCLKGFARGQGWSDGQRQWDFTLSAYQSSEIQVLGVYRGTASSNVIIVYLRGGENYNIITDGRAVRYGSGYNVGTSSAYNTVAMIKDANGNDVAGQTDTSQRLSAIANTLSGGVGRYYSHESTKFKSGASFAGAVGFDQRIHVAGSDWNGGGTEGNRTDLAMTIPENKFIYTLDGSNVRKLIGKSGDFISIGESGTSLIDGINYFSGTACDHRWYSNSSIAMNLSNSGLSINTTGGNSLRVTGAGSNSAQIYATGANYGMRIDGVSNNNVYYLMFLKSPSYDVFMVKPDGKVGINRTNPLYPLHVEGIVTAGDTSSTGSANRTGISNQECFEARSTSAGLDPAISFHKEGVYTMYMQGSNSPRGLRVLSPSSETIAGLYVQGDVVAYYSDMRLKTKLGDIKNPVDKIKALNGFYYEPNEKAQEYGYEKERRIGLSAQDVKEVIPEAVHDAPMGDGYMAVDYAKLVPVLVEAIKEQQKQIDELKAMIYGSTN